MPFVHTLLRTGVLMPPVLAGCASAPTRSEPAAVTVSAPAPTASDLRPQFTAYGLPPRPQGHRPTCSIFTTVAAFEFAFARATRHGENAFAEVTAEFVRNEINDAFVVEVTLAATTRTP